MREEFVFNERLGVYVPELSLPWDDYPHYVRMQIVEQWEQIRGSIPEQIVQFEKQIIRKQNQLNIEENFPLACRLNAEIAELASRINDLHLWYRANQEIDSRVHE